MLSEDEWIIIHEFISLEAIKNYRKEHNVGLAEAKLHFEDNACAKFNAMTGSNESNMNNIWHHRNIIYGPDCEKCGKPYRTPQARYCVECGDGIDKLQGT